MKRTHVLFDLDGTISDSEPGIVNSLMWAFEQVGMAPPTREQVRSVIGPPFEIGLPTIGVSPDRLDEIVAIYRERYTNIGAYENTVYEGISRCIDDLRARSVTLGVATAKPEVMAHPILDHFGLSPKFAVRAGATLDATRRHKADIIAHALDHFDLTSGEPGIADRVIMLGDRHYDIVGAAEHGIPAIGVAWGYGSIAELTDAGAVAIAQHPDDLLDLVTAEYPAFSR